MSEPTDVRAAVHQATPACVDAIAHYCGHETLDRMKASGTLVEVDGVWRWPEGNDDDD